MPVLSQIQISEQMVAQLRLLRPSVSAEVGTPERLIIDTVAGALAEDSIDLVGLQQALNIDTKYGSNLTNFLAIFGFTRQQPTTAKGFVIFSRNSPANIDILIPSGTIVSSGELTEGLRPEFYTITSTTLQKGRTETELVPVRATSPGVGGNLPANSLTDISGLAPVLGVTAVTNPTATSGGSEIESDNELKVRFKNTVFRNLAGTEDQYLALAVATAFSTKANVVGPISKYQEYIQVPPKADNEEYAFGEASNGDNITGVEPRAVVRGSIKKGTKEFLTPATELVNVGEKITIYEGVVNPKKVISASTVASVTPGVKIETTAENTTVDVTNGTALIGERTGGEIKENEENKWTTALSDNPFAKDIWPTLPVFISDARSGISSFFFREGADFNFNYPAKFQGDTLRAYVDNTGNDPRKGIGANQPNATFINIYLGTQPEAVQALAPESVVLLEYAYTSSSSRNSLKHNVTNAVDVFVDGANRQPSSTTFTRPISTSNFAFVDNQNNAYYYENYRRDGEPTKRPLVGNILTPLFQEPIVALPPQITIGASNYYLGVHYWLVHEVAGYAGSIRARDGIEWSWTVKGDKGGAGEGKPTEAEPEPKYTGTRFGELSSLSLIEVLNYEYDQNIVDLQAAFEGARQVTTDTLAHRAKTRYFKLDITVVYAQQSTPSTVNESIREALQRFLESQYFGSVIRMSDLLRVVANTSGVENVRWTNDLPNIKNRIFVYETDNNGLPLRGVTVDRREWGGEVKERQGIYIAGNLTGGIFTLLYGKKIGEKETTAISLLALAKEASGASELKSKIEAAISPETVSVEADKRTNGGVEQILQSYQITYGGTGKQTLPTIRYPRELSGVKQIVPEGGEYVFDFDFFLRDNELPLLPENAQPEDTVPGLIIRSRAENVWQRS